MRPAIASAHANSARVSTKPLPSVSLRAVDRAHCCPPKALEMVHSGPLSPSSSSPPHSSNVSSKRFTESTKHARASGMDMPAFPPTSLSCEQSPSHCPPLRYRLEGAPSSPGTGGSAGPASASKVSKSLLPSSDPSRAACATSSSRGARGAAARAGGCSAQKDDSRPRAASCGSSSGYSSTATRTRNSPSWCAVWNPNNIPPVSSSSKPALLRLLEGAPARLLADLLDSSFFMLLLLSTGVLGVPGADGDPGCCSAPWPRDPILMLGGGGSVMLDLLRTPWDFRVDIFAFATASDLLQRAAQKKLSSLLGLTLWPSARSISATRSRPMAAGGASEASAAAQLSS
mmetsp:Transcript_56165/g.177986  ORF Transcript_56165/g.177986 Transcript_56165/m.177986 type:complete len:344 (+) Transcript_56165:146-1177(+)